jgi:carnitine O-acetyltransferase
MDEQKLFARSLLSAAFRFFLQRAVQGTNSIFHFRRALAFVKAFNSDASPREKVAALRAACKAHTELTKACAKGLGQDRLLYAMYCLAQQKEKAAARGDSSAPPSDSESSDSEDSDKFISRIPELFKDPGYAKLGSSTISTSNCGNPALRLFGFGPVAADGFGLGYIIKVSSSRLVQNESSGTY